MANGSGASTRLTKNNVHGNAFVGNIGDVRGNIKITGGAVPRAVQTVRSRPRTPVQGTIIGGTRKPKSGGSGKTVKVSRVTPKLPGSAGQASSRGAANEPAKTDLRNGKRIYFGAVGGKPATKQSSTTQKSFQRPPAQQPRARRISGNRYQGATPASLPFSQTSRHVASRPNLQAPPPPVSSHGVGAQVRPLSKGGLLADVGAVVAPRLTYKALKIARVAQLIKSFHRDLRARRDENSREMTGRWAAQQQAGQRPSSSARPNTPPPQRSPVGTRPSTSDNPANSAASRPGFRQKTPSSNNGWRPFTIRATSTAGPDRANASRPARAGQKAKPTPAGKEVATRRIGGAQRDSSPRERGSRMPEVAVAGKRPHVEGRGVKLPPKAQSGPHGARTTLNPSTPAARRAAARGRLERARGGVQVGRTAAPAGTRGGQARKGAVPQRGASPHTSARSAVGTGAARRGGASGTPTPRPRTPGQR